MKPWSSAPCTIDEVDVLEFQWCCPFDETERVERHHAAKPLPHRQCTTCLLGCKSVAIPDRQAEKYGKVMRR